MDDLLVIDLRMFEMEKEKHNDSYPRGVIDESIRNPENGSNSPKDKPSSSQTSPSTPRTFSRWHNFFKMWKRSSVKKLPSFPPLTVPRMSTRKSRSARENVAAGIYHFTSSWKNFSLSELKNATNNFSKGMFLFDVSLSWIQAKHFYIYYTLMVLPMFYYIFQKFRA